MARTRRIKLAGRDAIYHIMSRTAGRHMLLADAGVKRDMLRALERSAEFSGVEVLGFALMDNHFHLVVRIPSPEEPVPEPTGDSPRSLTLRFCALTIFDKNRRSGFCRGDVHESPVP